MNYKVRSLVHIDHVARENLVHTQEQFGPVCLRESLMTSCDQVHINIKCRNKSWAILPQLTSQLQDVCEPGLKVNHRFKRWKSSNSFLFISLSLYHREASHSQLMSILMQSMTMAYLLLKGSSGAHSQFLNTKHGIKDAKYPVTSEMTAVNVPRLNIVE